MDEPVLSREVVIVNTLGLHARAASRFVASARRYKADIEVTCGDRSVDGKSIVSLLTLAGSRGRALQLTARGADAPAALEALVELVGTGFGEGVAGD